MEALNTKKEHVSLSKMSFDCQFISSDRHFGFGKENYWLVLHPISTSCLSAFTWEDYLKILTFANKLHLVISDELYFPGKKKNKVWEGWESNSTLFLRLEMLIGMCENPQRKIFTIFHQFGSVSIASSFYYHQILHIYTGASLI